MLSYDESCAECWVFTFKQGLLSPVAHDLRLRVGRFRVELDEAKTQVRAQFDASSVYVETALKDGADIPQALSADDEQKIAGQIRDRVLQAGRYPSITFRSTRLSALADGGYEVLGELTLHGAVRALRAQSRLVAGRQQLELSLHQPDFGIEPFSALLGTLKLRSDVKVRLVL
jgi:polyisoprenoid-binding protein YceI